MMLPYYLLIPLLVGISTQILKFVFRYFTKRDVTFKYMNSYGGFPSSHSALTTSLATIILLVQGIYSIEFAIAMVVMVITIRDAIGIRMFVSEHSEALNRIISQMPKLKGEPIYPHLEEQLGHKVSEVMGGVFFGIVLTLIYYKLFIFH